MKHAWMLVLLVAPVCAQRAQLPRRGRQLDPAAPRELTPIRKLPRRLSAPMPTAGNPLDDYISKAIARQPPPRTLPEDRLRPLVRRVPDPNPPPPLPMETAGLLYPLPRRPAQIAIAQIPQSTIEATPVPSRWQIPAANPGTARYDDRKLDAIYAHGHAWDPFNRNTLKGDYPLFGRHTFLDISVSSETLAEERRLPVSSPPSAAEPDNSGFFGNGNQFAMSQNFRVSFDLFGGSAGFSPVSWELRVTPEFNVNYLMTNENALVNVNVLNGTARTDTATGMQELFFEKRLFTNSTSALRPAPDSDDRGSAYFDFTSLRFGIQRFTSDFRGFIFSDEQPGARLFGTFANNIYQYNLAFFNMLEKDTNSGLNQWREREQKVFIANLYRNDFLTKGYNVNVSLLYNDDLPSFLIDKDGFLVRPTPLGNPFARQGIRAGYAGITGDGHVGRIGISDAFYDAFGRESSNPFSLTPKAMHINAQMAALELSYEKDWMTWKASFFFASGDGNVSDGRATGFDAIVPDQQFAGGGFLGSQSLADRGLINNQFEGGGVNFLNREAIPLTGTDVFLFGINSLLPDMRGGLFEGQSNFVNPGILLYNAGMDAKITPKLKSTFNVNYLKFDRTEVLEAVLFQNPIHSGIGVDAGYGLQYRPLLSDNVVVTGGFGALFPQEGFKDLYNGRVLFSAFLNVRLVF
jgi:hypothetical protein